MKIIKGVGERLLPHWIAAELRPILAFSGAGASLLAGSRILLLRGWDLLGAHLHGWEKAGAVLGGGYLIGYACWHAPHIAQFAAPAAAVGWCVAAWWAVPPPAPEPPAAPAEEEPPELTRDELAAIVRRVAEDRQGAHLADLLTTPELVGWTQPELKATAGLLRLPVGEFKLILDGRQRVRDGIRVRDLPPGPPSAPPADPSPEPLPDALSEPG